MTKLISRRLCGHGITVKNLWGLPFPVKKGGTRATETRAHSTVGATQIGAKENAKLKKTRSQVNVIENCKPFTT